jgi:large subunit ribosomal protein L13
MNQRTFWAKPEDAAANRTWWVVDAADKPLGRLASQIAAVLRGKHKQTFTPSVDVGDFVVVINAGKIKLTGQKMEQKHYYHHSGSPGGIRAKAVKGMLPKNVLGRQILTKLKVYAAPDHPHAAQKPQPFPST